MAPSMRDEPGKQREYETIFILRSDTPNDGIAQVNTRIRGVIEQSGGKLLRLDNWGKRKLAYEINKQLKGTYLYWQYLGGSGLVQELERNLRLLDPVIRYYTTVVDENVDPAARPSNVTDESFAQAATPGPDEEEIMLGAGPARSFEEDADFEIDLAAEEAALRRAAAEAEAAEEEPASAAAATPTETKA